MTIDIQEDYRQIRLSEITPEIADWLRMLQTNYSQADMDFTELLALREDDPDMLVTDDQVQHIITNTIRNEGEVVVAANLCTNILAAAIQTNNNAAFMFFWNLLQEEYKIAMLSSTQIYDILTNHDMLEDGAVGSLFIIALLKNNEELAHFIASEALARADEHEGNLLDKQVNMSIYTSVDGGEIDLMTWLYQSAHDQNKDEAIRDRYKDVAGRVVEYIQELSPDIPLPIFDHTPEYPENSGGEGICRNCIDYHHPYWSDLE